jgi:hypothetical protein
VLFFSFPSLLLLPVSPGCLIFIASPVFADPPRAAFAVSGVVLFMMEKYRNIAEVLRQGNAVISI